jgi:hypothetical protein
MEAREKEPILLAEIKIYLTHDGTLRIVHEDDKTSGEWTIGSLPRRIVKDLADINAENTLLLDSIRRAKAEILNAVKPFQPVNK